MLSVGCVKPEDVAAAVVLVLVFVRSPKVAVADAVPAVVLVEGSTVVN